MGSEGTSMNTLRTAARDIQGTALFLIVFGALICAAGCKENWGELKTLGAAVAGAGVQAITAQVRNALGEKPENPN